MKSLGRIEQARFWRRNAGQLREMVRATMRDDPTAERLRDLASEYDRLADNVDPTNVPRHYAA